MKKSQLRNIIKESIKELMTEQIPSPGPVCQMSLKTCQCYPGFGTGPCGTATSGGAKYPQVNGACPLKGDVIEVTGWNSNGPVKAFVRMVNTVTGYAYGRTWTPLPSFTSCSGCCSNWGGYGGGSGACWNTCQSGNTTTSGGFCNPAAWSNHANWTSTFTNTVNNFPASNTNQPCTFLNNKIAQFTAGAAVPGQGGYQNIQNCKLDLATQLHTQNNC